MNLDIPFDIMLVLGHHINESEIGVAVMDADNILQFHNLAFAMMAGSEGRSLVGRKFDDAVAAARFVGDGPCPEWPALHLWLEQARTAQRLHPFRSFEVHLKNGRWVMVNQQYHDRGMLVTLCIDVTAKKHTELALLAAHDELERLAMTDELTGVPNRRHFLTGLEKERTRAIRYGHTNCLAFIDLDYFKKVNDLYGHPAGDEVLKHFAGILRNHVRAEDSVGRLGGEEFALLLPETTLKGAYTVVERMRAELGAATLDHIAQGLAYTFSAGVAEHRSANLSCKAWLSAADEALYQAKARGRNQTVIYEPSGDSAQTIRP